MEHGRRRTYRLWIPGSSHLRTEGRNGILCLLCPVSTQVSATVTLLHRGAPPGWDATQSSSLLLCRGWEGSWEGYRSLWGKHYDLVLNGGPAIFWRASSPHLWPWEEEWHLLWSTKGPDIHPWKKEGGKEGWVEEGEKAGEGKGMKGKGGVRQQGITVGA